jgi:hypothetical protein
MIIALNPYNYNHVKENELKSQWKPSLNKFFMENVVYKKIWKLRIFPSFKGLESIFRSNLTIIPPYKDLLHTNDVRYCFIREF